jgi:hypothetical protein
MTFCMCCNFYGQLAALTGADVQTGQIVDGNHSTKQPRVKIRYRMGISGRTSCVVVAVGLPSMYEPSGIFDKGLSTVTHVFVRRTPMW